jgi:hypothetical protein
MVASSRPTSPTDRILRDLEIEHKREADGRSAAWAFLWTLFAFKIATVLIIIYAASGSGESVTMAIVTTWYWFIIPVLALAGPLLVRWRMLRMRRNRERLRASEWTTGEPLVVMRLPPPEHPGPHLNEAGPSGNR